MVATLVKSPELVMFLCLVADGRGLWPKGVACQRHCVAWQRGHGINGPPNFRRFTCCARKATCAACSRSEVFRALCFASVRWCIFSSLLVKYKRIRNMSESLPSTKSPHGGRFLKAVMAKLSERVKATNGKPCLDAGRKRLLQMR